MSECCIGIRDTDGIDLGYKLVPKKDLLKPLNQNSDNLIRGGELWVWGDNANGVLGINNNASTISSPIQTVAAGTNWKSITVSIRSTVAATKTDGTLWLWGCNADGALGDNSTVPKSSPVQTISGGTNWKSISAGPGVNLAIKTNGELWFWGNGCCQPTVTGALRSSPVQIGTRGINWKQISAGGTIFTVTSGGITEDGCLFVWGRCFNSSTPSQPVLNYTPTEDIKWCDVQTGQNALVAIKENGTMWTWGACNLNTIGVDNFSCFQQSIDGECDWKSLQKSSVVNSIVALKRDNSAWNWGYNSWFLSNEYIPAGGFFYYSPQAYGAPMSVPVGKNSWLCLLQSEGSNNVLGIKTDGTLWAWGSSRSFALQQSADYNTNSNPTVRSPVQIGFCSGWKNVGAIGSSAFAIK